MIWNEVELAIVLMGLAMTPVLFFRFPRLEQEKTTTGRFPSVSVIIPARNEKNTLPFLLEDLKTQTLKPLEVILVDDDSSDGTAQIAQEYGARVISLHDKPASWIGKSWACQNGADAAKGERLLFLDADVRMGKNGILRLMETHLKAAATVSLQPFHETKKLYEQCSMLFNFIQIGANGTTLPHLKGVGLYGPVILIQNNDYQSIGGHESVKDSIVEDMALAQKLKEKKLPYRVFVGDEELTFRMYGDGLTSLLQGWTKNMAAGAGRTPPYLAGMVFLWMASLISTPVHVLLFATAGNTGFFLIYSLIYMVWALVLLLYSRKFGRFRPEAALLFPVLAGVFLGVFFLSVWKKAFGVPVVWKGRRIGKEKARCK